MPLTKLASIQHILWGILEGYNIDPAPLFREAGLDESLMFEPGARYPLRKIARLWQLMAEAIDDPCFGLKTAKHYHPSHFGTMGYAMMASSSLRMSLERLVRFHRVVSDAGFAKLYEDSRANTLNIALNWHDESPWTPAREDAALTFLVSSCRLNFQGRLNPKRVEFSHTQMVCLAEYENFFGCRVHFGCPAPLLAFSLKEADETLRSGDEFLAQFHDKIMEEYVSTLEKNKLKRKIQRILLAGLPSGMISIDSVARQLGMSTRTLQRELKQEGTTYQDLLNQTRHELAERYVSGSYNELTEVAFLLGFSDLSTFSRSFKRWTGSSPGRYRRQAQLNNRL